MVEPENVGNEATSILTSTEVLAKETKAHKKKKKQKKDAGLEKFRLEQREAKAKEMSKIKHRKLQREQDFRGRSELPEVHSRYPVGIHQWSGSSGLLDGKIPKTGQLHE